MRVLRWCQSKNYLGRVFFLLIKSLLCVRCRRPHNGSQFSWLEKFLRGSLFETIFIHCNSALTFSLLIFFLFAYPSWRRFNVYILIPLKVLLSGILLPLSMGFNVSFSLSLKKSLNLLCIANKERREFRKFCASIFKKKIQNFSSSINQIFGAVYFSYQQEFLSFFY